MLSLGKSAVAIPRDDVGIVLYNSISKIPDSPDAMLIF